VGEEKAAEPVVEEKATETTVEEKTDATEPSYTFEQVRAKAVELSKGGKKDAVQALWKTSV